MHTRILIGAFLTYQNKVLLMKRGLHKKIAPGLWSCIGGHLEAEEIINPRQINHTAAIYREIKEEANIDEKDILNLDLRYISMRIDKDDNEIRAAYYYIGKVTQEFEPPYCDEGVFYWTDIKDIIDLPMSFSIKEIVKHWVNNPESNNIFLFGINKNNNQSTVVEL